MNAMGARALVAAIVGLALVLAPAAHAAAMTGMNMGMSAVADMPMSEDCGACVDRDAGTALGMCMASCTVSAAIVGEPMSLASTSAAPAFAPPEAAASDRQRPPDPYPPRSNVNV